MKPLELYTKLTYSEYKAFEEDIERFKELETVHRTDKCYHKAFRIRLGPAILEVQGPLVKTYDSSLFSDAHANADGG